MEQIDRLISEDQSRQDRAEHLAQAIAAQRAELEGLEEDEIVGVLNELWCDRHDEIVDGCIDMIPQARRLEVYNDN